MHFVVIGRDGTDPQALQRRLAARAAHLAAAEKYKAAGNLLLGVALLNDAGAMCGSVMLFDFADRPALDAWLRDEPYVTGKVWESIEVHQGAIGPAFVELFAPRPASG